MDLSWYYIKGVLTLVGIYMLPVLGLSLLTGFTGLFSFGHAGFMAVGGYATAFMMMKMGLPFIPSLLIGGLMASIASLIIGRLTLNLKGDYFCIATLGFGEAIRLVLDNVQYFGGARGWPGLPIKTDLITVIIIDFFAVMILRSIIMSRQGRNMIAIREEELASQVVGIDVFKYKLTSLFISAFYAGIGGGLLGTYMGFLQPKIFSLTKSTELTIMVIFGGLGSISGSVLGTIVLVSLPEILREFANWRLVAYGIVVVFIMIARPEGLLGGKEIGINALRSLVLKLTGNKKQNPKPTVEGSN
jgi:branched-chain amino acid transport system permease protein